MTDSVTATPLASVATTRSTRTVTFPSSRHSWYAEAHV